MQLVKAPSYIAAKEIFESVWQLLNVYLGSVIQFRLEHR
jgi:hypothetical protein